MKYNLPLVLLALVLGLCGGAGSAQAGAGGQLPPAGTGVLTGVVTRGPTSPVQGPGLPPATAPAPGVKLGVYGPGRQEVATVVSGEAGQYRLELPPGQYRVEMELGPGRGFTKDLPAPVTISPGRETRLNIRIDTGLR